jgi:Mn2+/Fe2+ NRAMP family transporter
MSHDSDAELEIAGRSGLFDVVGPGLLFAAAAIGVSHLVQSTRAGAVYGMAMLGLIILANAAKYAAFRFGPHYAAATGRSLLEGYRRQGTGALVLYASVTLGTMFTVQAAVTVVTAGLVQSVFGLTVGPVAISAMLLFVCASLLAVGRYRWLDRITRVLVGALALCTLVATALVLPEIDWAGAQWTLAVEALDRETILFAAALVGWMPSAIDIAVWNSLWTLAKGEERGRRQTLDEAMLDFHVGYLGTALFAVCFMLLGAGVLGGRDVEIAGTAGGFAAQVIGLYTETLGAWSEPVIGFSAIAVMFSTTLTVLDGFPRALATLFARFREPERPDHDDVEHGDYRVHYWVSMVVLAMGSLLALYFLLTSLPRMVDIATTLSFLTAPLLALLNHRAVLGDEVPEEARPAGWLVTASLAGIAALSAFAVYYLWLIFAV